MPQSPLRQRLVPEYLRRNVPIAVPSVAPGSSELVISPAGAPASSPTFQRQFYGDMNTITVNFPGAGGALCLERPKNTRVSLLIQNLGNFPMYYAFGLQPSNVSGVMIAANGNRNFVGFIPQNDLFIYSMGTGIAIIEYSNNDITVS